MKDFLRVDLKYKENPSKPQEKDPYHHHILDFANIYRYGHQYMISDLPTLKIYVKFFVVEKVWLRNTLPTMWTNVQNFVVFFPLLNPLLTHNFKTPEMSVPDKSNA